MDYSKGGGGQSEAQVQAQIESYGYQDSASVAALIAAAGHVEYIDQPEIFAQRGRIKRTSTTEITLTAPIWGKIWVNGEFVDVSSGKVCTIGDAGDNTIAADGTDSGSKTSALTKYYFYISNSLASYASSSLRASATAPTQGYLAASGNGAHWRHVAFGRTSGANNMWEEFSLCGFGLYGFEKFLTSDHSKTSGSAEFYEIQGWNVELMPGSVIIVNAKINTRYDGALTREMRTRIIGQDPTITNCSAVAANDQFTMSCMPLAYVADAYDNEEIRSELYYPGSGTMEALHDNPNSADGKGTGLVFTVYTP